MKMLVCIIDNFYADYVERNLREKGYRMTELASSGGFLKRGNTTFLFGVEEVDLKELRQSLQEACLNLEKKKQRKAKQVHRYTSFLMDVKDTAPLFAIH
ncbi:cyclic-di-AMP receptor [Bacillus solitudinis]|uniref:cyclic-di-AMP receptor n=1 Tax=Bacillus solitudinis TaxID=2014074 RepID=UPI000C249593|nr:cyclic-di-AMP receptor [Bacillus solitudinis]